MSRFAPLTLAAALLLCPSLATASPVQEQAEAPSHTVRVTPAAPALRVGETLELKIEVLDAAGEVVDVRTSTYSRNRRAVSVGDEGLIQALKPGRTELVVRAFTRPERIRHTVVVDVAYPPIAGLRFQDAPERLFTGTGTELAVEVLDATGAVREDVRPELVVADPSIVQVDAYGQVWAQAAGSTTVTARYSGASADPDAGLATTLTLSVLPNPTASIHLAADAEVARTGDVVHLKAMALDGDGQARPEVPVHLSFTARPDDTLGNAATGQITQDGRFVAQAPGLYTFQATSGGVVQRMSLRVDARDVRREFKTVGQGIVNDVHTSDLWVWEGVDGRDYCVTGTWGGNGEAHFWDVTDPAAIERIATVTVDARTVNDVKVSEDGRICVLSREGASNRKNGIVILDVTEPANPEILSTYTEELTGGVHNVFIYEDHVYALSGARRYDIINIVDPRAPRKVGSFELETEGRSIHDVWVKDGIAYSSNWSDGVVLVDVGNGIAGGSPENPVEISRYAYPSGWNHAAWPHTNEETGIEYVIAGDEAFPFGLNITGKPTYARGWLHFIDFTDKANPQEVARYEVPEAGTHNLWVEDDVLYVAYYNGGIRAVDISGELMGDLYHQGREIGAFLPAEPEGFVPNAPMVWGPQPHKGHLFFSDWNSGLWSVKLEPSVGE